jgi:hypothetical protein
MALDRWIVDTLRRVNKGEMDFTLLNALTARLNATQFNDQGAARAARQLIQAADDRKRFLGKYYREQLPESPALGPQLDRLYPGWRKW